MRPKPQEHLWGVVPVPGSHGAIRKCFSIAQKSTDETPM